MRVVKYLEKWNAWIQEWNEMENDTCYVFPFFGYYARSTDLGCKNRSDGERLLAPETPITINVSLSSLPALNGITDAIITVKKRSGCTQYKG